MTNKMGELSLAMPDEAATAAAAGWAAKILRRLVEGRRARLKPTAAHAAEALSRAGKT